MAGPVLLRNASDTWTDGRTGYTTRNHGTMNLLRLRTGSGDWRAWLYFSRPFPLGATITGAYLRLYPREAWTSITVTAQRPSARWGVNSITHANQPGVIGATASVVHTGIAGGEVLLDVTAIMQAVSNGGAWYGLRIIASGSGSKSIHSAQSTTAALRPTLELNWVDEPEAPTVMSPSGNRAVSIDKPILSFNYVDPSADSPLAAAQVQIDPSAAWGAPAFDSGEVVTTVPQIELASTAYAGLALNASTYWRVRVKDAAGLWSEWSHTVAGTGNQFRRVAKGTLTITNPAASPNNFVWEPTPPFTWTFTGQTQRHYQVLVVDSAQTSKILWTSGKITGTTTVVHPPSTVLKDTTMTYRLIIRIWDTIDREANGLDPVYVEAWREFTYNYDATVAPVTDLSVAVGTILPEATLTWSRASQPDYWVVTRGGETLPDSYVVGSDLFVSGTSYQYVDRSATARESHTWRAIAIVNGRQSSSNPTINGEIKLHYPFLMRPDGTDAVAFLNPKRDMVLRAKQEIHEIASSRFPPVLITQSLGGYAGHVEGLFHEAAIPGVTARQMRDRFRSLREDTGVILNLFLVDETLKVVAYNLDISPDSSPSGVAYFAKFDYVQVDA